MSISCRRLAQTEEEVKGRRMPALVTMEEDEGWSKLLLQVLSFKDRPIGSLCLRGLHDAGVWGPGIVKYGRVRGVWEKGPEFSDDVS